MTYLPLYVSFANILTRRTQKKIDLQEERLKWGLGLSCIHYLSFWQVLEEWDLNSPTQRD